MAVAFCPFGSSPEIVDAAASEGNGAAVCAGAAAGAVAVGPGLEFEAARGVAVEGCLGLGVWVGSMGVGLLAGGTAGVGLAWAGAAVETAGAAAGVAVGESVGVAEGWGVAVGAG